MALARKNVKNVKNARKFVVVSGLTLPLAYLLWIVFVGTFSLHELVIGIIAAVLAVTGMVVVTLQYPGRFSPRLSEVLLFWRLPGAIVAGTWSITMIALKDFTGTKRADSLFRQVPFDAGREEDPHAAARRALAVLYATTTPPTIVLGVNTNDQTLLFHEMKRSPVSQLLKKLGARG